MKSAIVTLVFLAVALLKAMPQQVSFVGGQHAVYEDKPAASTGLDCIYVIYDCDGVSMNYTQASNAAVTWYTYGELGGGYATVADGVVRVDSRTTQLPQVKANCGYIIEEGTTRTYVWVVNYADYHLSLNAISLDNERDCGTARLNVDGSGPSIVYYTINGAMMHLDRDLTLSYRTLEWNDTNMAWEETQVESEEEDFEAVMAVQAPYCNTEFTLSGDRFLRYWNMEETVTSDTYLTSAIAVETTAVQEERTVENEQKDDASSESSLGGSAPVTITFTAYCTDAMAHAEWQMARDAEFADIDSRFAQDEITQTFNEGGTFYYRFYGADSSGECETTSETYTITIGESVLECPNAFSPQGSEGINDEWRVSYRSIVEFQCWIFNRWGVEICHLTDPSQGWDGKYKGKYVKSGVYFYVIEARGADGKEYKLSGDINILNYTGIDNGSSGIE